MQKSGFVRVAGKRRTTRTLPSRLLLMRWAWSEMLLSTTVQFHRVLQDYPARAWLRGRSCATPATPQQGNRAGQRSKTLAPVAFALPKTEDVHCDSACSRCTRHGKSRAPIPRGNPGFLVAAEKVGARPTALRLAGAPHVDISCIRASSRASATSASLVASTT